MRTIRDTSREMGYGQGRAAVGALPRGRAAPIARVVLALDRHVILDGLDAINLARQRDGLGHVVR